MLSHKTPTYYENEGLVNILPVNFDLGQTTLRNDVTEG